MKVYDSHLHINDTKFPLIENQGFMPDAFTCADYLHSVSNLNLLEFIGRCRCLRLFSRI